jgi:hypothetical protein
MSILHEFVQHLHWRNQSEVKSMRKYVCSICKEEYYSIEDILQHLKSAKNEEHKNIDKEDLDAYFDVIDLDSREWTDFPPQRIKVPPIKTEPSVPKELLPKDFIRGEEYPTKPYYYDGTYFYCSEHKYKTNDDSEFLAHVLKYHSKDFEIVLKHLLKTNVQKQIVQGVKEESLKELLDIELQKWLKKVEEKAPEQLTMYIDDYFTRLKAFLTGQEEICPLCNRLCTINNTLHLEKIFNGLRKVVQLKGKEYYDYLQKLERENKGYQYWISAKYLCQWNGEDIPIKLYPLLHLYLDHPERFESLAGILQGDLIDYLREKKYLKQREVQTPKPIEPAEKLSKGIVIKRKENLSQGEQALLNWLDKERVKKQ